MVEKKKPAEWQLCIKKQGIMWPGSLNIPRRSHTKKKTGSGERRGGGGSEERRRRERRKNNGCFPLPPLLTLATCVNIHKLCSYIILPWYLMSQASPPWHLRLARQPLLQWEAYSLTYLHTHTYTHAHTHAHAHAHTRTRTRTRTHNWPPQVTSSLSCQKKSSCKGLRVFVRQFWTRQVLSSYKYMNRREACWWIWGETPSAPSEPVITDASLFMTADKIALLAAFYKTRTRTRTHTHTHKHTHKQVYLVWQHTSHCQDVPCRAMIVLAASV